MSERKQRISGNFDNKIKRFVTVYYFFTQLNKLIPGLTITSYWQNLVSDIIIFFGLLMTIVTARGQREALKQGFVRAFKGDNRLADLKTANES